MKNIIRAAIAVVATTGLMLTAAPAAFAATPASASSASAVSSSSSSSSSSSARDFDDSFEQESRNGLATLEAEYSVRGDEEDDNTFRLRGELYDGDRRTFRQGGRCAYVEVQVVSSGDEDWDVAKRDRLCSYDDTKRFRVTAHDVSDVRVKTCQVKYRSWSTHRCSRWEELDLGF
ncbi:hypothetical protein AB0F88_10520 [Streptosporangium sp. NPDC023963]|uniref:hypothetical protein n=1 Tax=Streptosporangium sp. NPDC023963 TaxID=3155608 RepID=UPI0034266A78